MQWACVDPIVPASPTCKGIGSFSILRYPITVSKYLFSSGRIPGRVLSRTLSLKKFQQLKEIIWFWHCESISQAWNFESVHRTMYKFKANQVCAPHLCYPGDHVLINPFHALHLQREYLYKAGAEVQLWAHYSWEDLSCTTFSHTGISSMSSHQCCELPGC